MQETTKRNKTNKTHKVVDQNKEKLSFKPNKFYMTGHVTNRRHLGKCSAVYGIFNNYRLCLRYNIENLDIDKEEQMKLIEEDIALIESKKNPKHCDIIDLYVEDRPIVMFKVEDKLDIAELDKELRREIAHGLYV